MLQESISISPARGVRLLTNAVNILWTSAMPTCALAWSGAGRKRRSRAKSRWYSSSLADPRAICRNRLNSRSDRRPHPSAMLAAMEAAARRSWLVSPYISSFGNLCVSLYIASVSRVSFLPYLKIFEVFHFSSQKSVGPNRQALAARSQQLEAKSSLQNSSLAAAGSCSKVPIRKERQKFLRRTPRVPGAQPVRRCGWIRQA